MLLITDLVKVYGTGLRALNGINLELSEPHVVTIIGSSGAGKSTLIRCINRLVEPTSGTILLDGTDVTALGRRGLRRARRRMGMIFQEYNLVERLTVMENVLSGRLGYVSLWRAYRRNYPAQDIAAAFELLERVGLGGYQDTRADALSGGQRQRVGIARALMQRPDLLLVDEPTASLDPKTARQIMRLICELAREFGTPTLVNIHDVALAQVFADRIVGLHDGKVVFDGGPDALSHDVLTDIYGEEDWSTTIRDTDSDDKKPARSDEHEAEHEANGRMSERAVWRPPKFIGNPVYRHGLTAAVVLYLIWSMSSLEIDLGRLAVGLPRAGNMFARMVPPDFSRWELLLRGLVESLQMALAASFFGMILAIPLGVCAAANLMPKPVYLAARAIIVLTRTFHEVVIAIFFVKIFGFGPLAGVFTLIVASTSFIAKMLAEDIENMSIGQAEAVRATGASFPKLLIYAIVPQILPRYLGVSIYRLDANVRHSTVVGIVGAGGIGQTLAASFSRYDYDFSLAILLTIIALVFVGEVFSNWVRRQLR